MVASAEQSWENEWMEAGPAAKSENVLLGTLIAGKPRLLDQVRGALRRKHYSLRTEEAYLGWVRRFILFHGKQHPASLGEEACRAVPHSSRLRKRCGRIDAKPGAGGVALSLCAGRRATTRTHQRNRASQATLGHAHVWNFPPGPLKVHRGGVWNHVSGVRGANLISRQ